MIKFNRASYNRVLTNNNVVNEDVTYTYLAHGYVNVTSTTLFKYYISTANTNNAIIFTSDYCKEMNNISFQLSF